MIEQLFFLGVDKGYFEGKKKTKKRKREKKDNEAKLLFFLSSDF